MAWRRGDTGRQAVAALRGGGRWCTVRLARPGVRCGRGGWDTAPRSFSCEGEQTHFGYRDVPVEEKVGLVKKVFYDVAEKYDIMNDFMSVGIHRLWKDELIKQMNPQMGMKLLDLAGGTGDISFRFAAAARGNYTIAGLIPGFGPRGTAPAPTMEAATSVTVCDINEAMLEVGQQRAVERGEGTDYQLNWVTANAEDLPFEDGQYDAVTISFGIRNCTHKEKVLQEAHRVLKRGGRFMCLEFGPTLDTALVDQFYKTYSFNVIPVVGEMIVGDRQPYDYFVQSIQKFPPPELLAAMMEEAGFKAVTHRGMTHGIVNIHSGFKL